MNIEPVAFFSSPLKEKFGVPRQSGLAPNLVGEVRFVPPYDAPEALRGLEGFDYCWLIWGF
ncbi:MAG: SAM-dependent methyltransferase, partial [Bacteroidales bacterium]|nr:SAM-dependent methyltransferase [Bacteroidales bacterium]